MKEENNIIINPAFQRFIEVFSMAGETLFSFGGMLLGGIYLVRLSYYVCRGHYMLFTTLSPVLLVWITSYYLRRKKLPAFRSNTLLKEIYYLAFSVSIFVLINIILVALGYTLPDTLNLLFIESRAMADELSLVVSESVLVFFSLMVVIGFSVIAKELYTGVNSKIDFIQKIRNERLKYFSETAVFFILFSVSTFLVFYFFGDKLSLWTRNLFKETSEIEAIIVFSPAIFFIKTLLWGSKFIEKGSEYVYEVLNEV